MQTTATPLLGIMVTEREGQPPFASSSFYGFLTEAGKSTGIQVFVFSPNRIHWQQRTISGHSYDHESGEWLAGMFPLPAFIYDRCFFTRKGSYKQYRSQVGKLRETPGIRFLGYGLAGKWEVQQILQREAALRPHLPETCLLTGDSVLEQWLTKREHVFLKPQGGSQGKGALHVRSVSQPDGTRTHTVQGRDSHNAPLHEQFPHFQECKAFVHKLVGTRSYLMQEYLRLHTSEGIAYDIRSFVQKNGSGVWETVGMAARIGKPGSVTSNLHGGGRAAEASSFLTQQFGAEKTADIVDTLNELSMSIPLVLEASHGRLVELGIDFGIDVSGRVWILEVNSKPGRSIFAKIGDQQARKRAIANPIRYAAYLWKTSHPGGSLQPKAAASSPLLHIPTVYSK